jgi:ATP-dependent helicase Lhr and Lhr-like helicase
VAAGFEVLGPTVQAHLAADGVLHPTPVQVAAMPRVAAGEHLLLVAPTGTGKTEAALLPLLRRVAAEPAPGVRLIHVTPLRALNRDLEQRLQRWATRLGVRIEARHGDTSAEVRRRQERAPPEVLLTTPETFQALLVNQAFRGHLRGVTAVVVDEAHALARDRRGVQLAVGMERLRPLAGEFQRVALSATAGDPAAVAALFGGARPLAVVDAGPPRALDVRIAWPAAGEEDVAAARRLRVGPEVAAHVRALRDALAAPGGGSLVFANSRLGAELVASRLRMEGVEAGVHHGSLDREVRQEAEAALREGLTPALVCTATLEMGLDVGRVAHVAQYASPRRAATLAQRIGRAAHRPGGVARGTVVATGALDALEAAVVLRRAREGALEQPRVHAGALDVLGHQLAGMALERGGLVPREEALAVVRGAMPYADLASETLERVASFLVGLGLLRTHPQGWATTGRTRHHHLRNLAMFNEQQTYPVVDLADGRTLAVLGEEEVQRYARPGHTFVVRGVAWRIVRDGPAGELLVVAADDPGARVPDWEGEGVTVPFEVAQEVAALRARTHALEEREGGTAAQALLEASGLDAEAAGRVREGLRAQRAAGAPVPPPGEVWVEAFDHYLLVHAPFGEVVNETLGDILEELLARQGLNRFWWMDGYHILLETTVPVGELDAEGVVRGLFHHGEAEVEDLLTTFLDDHLPLGPRVKGPAERLGALPRGRFVGMEEWGPLERRFAGTVVEEEAMREVLLEHTDLPRVRALLGAVRAGALAVRVWHGPPTPLGRFLLDRYVEQPERLGGGDPGQGRRAAERLRWFARTERLALLCLDCGDLSPRAEVRHLPEDPACAACGSRVVAPLGGHAPLVQRSARAHLAGAPLPDQDGRELARARQAGALVAVHGRRAVEALAVYGVGPQAAARVLAAMHRDEAAHWQALLQARQRYLASRPSWDRDRGAGQPREPASKGYAYSPRASAFSDGRP